MLSLRGQLDRTSETAISDKSIRSNEYSIRSKMSTRLNESCPQMARDGDHTIVFGYMNTVTETCWLVLV
jgi:hypothetical protein